DIDIIFGVAINDKIGDSIIVSVIATGFDLPKPTMIATDGPAETKSPVAKKNVVEDIEDEIGFDTDVSDNIIPSFFRKG
ncbi:MAG TPA: cell division protein FtsZ, partial [Erysipelotrichaceae bacterium]|nr:cell division protein FtsZ [Erysipelotrichaceae bacterium]